MENEIKSVLDIIAEISKKDNYIGNFKLMLFKKQLDCLDMIIENLDSYLDELLSK